MISYEKNLEAMLNQSDSIDQLEGQVAYTRYRAVMQSLSVEYRYSIGVTIAAFVSLSPNSDYLGNLRSVVSVMKGLREGIARDKIVVSTYNHCKFRAIQYLNGERDFLQETKGPKIINFYHNVLDPSDCRWVTIDGHMVAAARGEALTMKEALCTAREYREIANAIKRIAFRRFYLPNQIQAQLWFTRKRLFKIRFEPQQSLFHMGNQWKTLVDTSQLMPYGSLP